MLRMFQFFYRHLDAATRLGEILFGLIMALGISGAVRLGVERVSNQELFISILGCNVAWGIVDGVMYVMLAMFERGRKARVIRAVQKAESEERALAEIAGEFDDRLESLTERGERERMYREILRFARRLHPEELRVQREDLIGGAAVALIILVATLPVVIPYLLVSNTHRAITISNLVALSQMFALGYFWGRAAGANPFWFGLGISGVGGFLVLVTIVLGG